MRTGQPDAYRRAIAATFYSSRWNSTSMPKLSSLIAFRNQATQMSALSGWCVPCIQRSLAVLYFGLGEEDDKISRRHPRRVSILSASGIDEDGGTIQPSRSSGVRAKVPGLADPDSSTYSQLCTSKGTGFSPHEAIQVYDD